MIVENKRKGRITGTTIGGIVGLSKYVTPIDVYRLVRGEIENTVDPDSPDILRGRYLEHGGRQWYRHITGNEVRIVPTMVHPKYDFLASTPDGHVLNPDGSPSKVLEIKFPRYPQDWGDSGTDDIPDYHVPQVALEMACADLPAVDVAAFVYGELRVYTLMRDYELEMELTRAAKDFWEEHVVPGIPPPVDGSKAYSDYLVERFPQKNKSVLKADTEQDDLLALYRDAKDRLVRAGEQEKALRNRLCKLLGDESAYGLTGAAGKAIWFERAGRSSLDIDGVLRELGVDPEILNRHRRVGKPSRSFRFTPKQEKE